MVKKVELSPGRYIAMGASVAACGVVPFPAVAVTFPGLDVTFPGNATGEVVDPGMAGPIVAAPGMSVPPLF
jgi:hypothetical protein